MSEKEIFLAALDKDSAERAAFQDEACAGDETLLATGPGPAGAAVALYTTGGNDDVNVGGPDSGYALTVDSRPLGGGASTAILGVDDESGTATIDNVPSGLDGGVAEALYAGKKPSTITYLGVEGVFTDPAARSAGRGAPKAIRPVRRRRRATPSPAGTARVPRRHQRLLARGGHRRGRQAGQAPPGQPGSGTLPTE